jgi:hypothetical protein
VIDVQRKTENIYPLIFLCVAVLLLLEIPLKSAIILVYVLAVIAGAGQKIAAKVGYNDVGIGIGIVVGVGAFVFSVQLLLIVGIAPALAHWSVILSMTAVLTFGRSRQSKPLISNKFLNHSDNYMAASVALVVATLRQPWMLPFTCVVVAIGIWHHRSKPTAKSVFIGSLLATIGWFASSLLRPNLWWYFYSYGDSQFFESLSWSIAKWGIFEHPGFVGGSIARYHWLTYAFFGGLSELAQLPPWFALTKIGPMFIYFLLAHLMITSAKESVSPRLAWNWIIVVLGILAARSQFVDSWACSIPIAFAFLHLAQLKLSASKLRLLFFWSFLSATLLFAKISTAIVIAAILGIKVFLDREKPTLPKLIPLVSLIFSGTTLAISIMRGPSNSMFGMPDYSINGINDFLRSLISVERFFPNLLICVSAALLLRSLLKTYLGSTGFAVAILTLPSLLVSTLFYAGDTPTLLTTVQQGSAEYFLFTQVFLLTIFCSIAMLSLDTRAVFQKTRSQNGLILGVLSIGLVAGFNWRHFGIGLLIGRAIPSEILSVLVAVLILSVVTVLWLTDRIFFYSLKTLLISFVFMSGILFSFKINTFFFNLSRTNHYYSLEETTIPVFGTSDLIAVGKFIRDNTNQEMVLASNNFYLQQVQGGSNYLLPAETQRRFLMQGLAFQTGLASPSTEQIKRMNLSLEFAYQPSALVLKRLKEYRVEGYVVNLALTDRRDWSEFATESFRSGDFVFLVFN